MVDILGALAISVGSAQWSAKMTEREALGDWIDGAFLGIPAEDRVTDWVESHDPARSFTSVFRAPTRVEHVGRAVEAARAAQRKWFALSQKERLTHLFQLQRSFENHVEEMAHAIVCETGKPHREAVGEAKALGARISLMANDGLERIATFSPDGVNGEARAHPQGVLAVLGPYNYPAHLLNAHVIPALITGNAVVLKPSEYCPWVGQIYAACAQEAGLPPGLLNLVQGGQDIGRALVMHPDVDGILFTGSSRTGRALTEACLDQPNKILALELGGKNAAVVLDDADLHQALAAIVQGAFLTTGQRCTATSRVLVHKTIYPRFVEALAGAIAELRPGDPWADDTLFGPLANAPAFDRFLRLRAQATALGLEARVPGETLDGGAYVTPSMHVLPDGHVDAPGYLDEELFGPDLCVECIQDDEHAIERMRANPYGLANSIFTSKSERFERFFRETRSGILNHNRSTNGASGKLPFGGVGKSGNQRPAGIDAVRYTTFPVAILRSEPGEIPVEDNFRAALGIGDTFLGLDVERLAIRHELEFLLESFRIPVDDVRGPDLLIPVHGLRILRLNEHVLEPERLVEHLQPLAQVSHPHLILTTPESDNAKSFLHRLRTLLEEIALENPILISGYPAQAIRRPPGGALPRSEALLRRMYQGEFVPREKKTPVIDLARSEGAYLRSIDDDPLEIVDAASQIATMGLGFQPGVFLRALDEDVVTPYLLHNAARDEESTAPHPVTDYKNFLLEHAGAGFSEVTFANGGAEANEKAFDLCRIHGPGGRRVIAFEGSFHGRTLTSLHATFNPVKRTPFEFAGYEAAFVPFPAWKDPREEPPVEDQWIRDWTEGRCPQAEDDPLLQSEIESLSAVMSEIEEGDICAVIVEPMQGEGGDNYATARFFQGLRALTRGLGVPLIFDEVQVGFGLGGPFYWHQLFHLRDSAGRPDFPDCVTLAKKAQLGVCVSRFPDPRPATPHVAQALRGLLHGRAIAGFSPDQIESQVRDHLWSLAVDFPVLVQNPRNVGWSFAFDLPSKHIANQVIAQRFYRGFMAYIAGEKTVRFRLNAAWTGKEVGVLFVELRAALESIADASRDVAPEAMLDAMEAYQAPEWEDATNRQGEREVRRKRFLAGEYERIAEDPWSLFSWLMALPRGPLERACDRILSIEGQLSDENLEAAISRLFPDRQKSPGVSVFLHKMRQLQEEIAKEDNPAARLAIEEEKLGVGLARAVVEYVGARLCRLQASEWEQYRAEIFAIECATYEEGRRDSEEELHDMVRDAGGIGLILLRRNDHGQRVIGYAFGGPVENYVADGPREDPLRGKGNTFYSSNITVAPKERGGGLGVRLKRAQVRLVSGLEKSDGKPRYAFMTGRNRIGHTREMAGINRTFGAYAVEYFRGNQYGDQSGEALYYRIPLRRPHVGNDGSHREHPISVAYSERIIDWSNGIQAPLGQEHPQLMEALQRGEFTLALGSKLTLSNFVTPNMIRYTELLREFAPKGLGHTYFTSGRDELVDKGIRCLRVKRTQGQSVLTLSNQFLGTTTAAARSLTDPRGHAEPFAWYEWPHVPHPALVGMDVTLERLRIEIEKKGPDYFLGLVVEVIGEQSGLTLTNADWEKLGTFRTETGIPLIFVETASALGRYGEAVFASEHLPTKPNCIWWYPGAQLGHIFVDDEYFVEKPLTLISTWDGDELSAIRNRYHLLEAKRLLPEKRAAKFDAAWKAMCAGLNEMSTQQKQRTVRFVGRGLRHAIHFYARKDARQFAAYCRKEKLRLEVSPANTVVVSPPIYFDEEEMREGLKRIERAWQAWISTEAV